MFFPQTCVGYEGKDNILFSVILYTESINHFQTKKLFFIILVSLFMKKMFNSKPFDY